MNHSPKPIVIDAYQKVDFNPKFAVNPNKFNPKQDCFDMDNHNQKAITWNEETGYVKFFDFTIPKFQRTLLWQLDLPICYAKLCPTNQWVWLIERNHQHKITILLYDYQGNLLTSQSVGDDYGWAEFLITKLPENNAIMLMFAYGQDGCFDYLVKWTDDKLQIQKPLDDNLSFLFCFDNNQKAVLLNFYDSLIHITSYPNFKVLHTYQFDDEMYYDGLEKITDTLWLFSDGMNFRYYVFNAKTLQIEKEIVIKDYEPQLNDDEINSKISAMTYDNGKLYFCYWGEWWGVAEFDVSHLV